MADDTRVLLLLEEVIDSGCAPEDVCRACPELLPAVLQDLERLRTFEAEVAAVFPAGGPQPRSTEARFLETALPVIPGYSVLGVLGRGGMGVVYEARDLRLTRTVAIKMLLAGGYATPSELARFIREAQAIAVLRHPHIIQIFDVDDLEGRPYFTMEYLEGGSLAEKMAGVPQPAKDAAAMVATLAQAIQAAHTAGIVHRDLKPSNILLTANGTPKISDFGLARTFDDGPHLTLGGTRLGTPSYMSPEQAIGRQDAIGPSADIYSLGAVLYEMLTGRPPFKAETPAETERQVITEEPAPPSRLNAKVPRDLETICLKCLRKEPQRRYESAAALAEDLSRFIKGEPITARPIGRLERAVRWCRRKPRETALIALAALLVLTSAGSGWWFTLQRTERRAEQTRHQEQTRRAIDGAIDQSVSMRHLMKWTEASAALDQATTLLGDDSHPDWLHAVAIARADLLMAKQLDRIRQAKAMIVDGKLDTAAAPASYARAFEEHGMRISVADRAATALAERIRTSSIKRELMDAMSDWLFVEPDTSMQTTLAAVLHQIDADPWRDRAREIAISNDTTPLADLVRDAPPDSPSVTLLVALADRMRGTGVDAMEFLQRVQLQHPTDFWASFALANALTSTDLAGASGYYRAALALRPDAAASLYNLGVALRKMNQLDEAIERFRQAAQVNPGSALMHGALGEALYARKLYDDAIKEYQLAASLDPTDGTALNKLGTLLMDRRRFDDAVRSCQQAAERDPDSAAIQSNLGLALQSAGRTQEALTHHELAVSLAPSDPLTHTNYALALQSLGRPDEAIEHCREALRLDPRHAKAHVNLGLSLQDKGRIDEAMEHYRTACVLDPSDPRPLVNLGQSELRKGRPGEAVNHLRKAIELNPDLVQAHSNLGAAFGQLGRMDDAIVQLRVAVSLDATFAPAHHNLGSALASTGRFEEAYAALSQALELYSSDDPRRKAGAQKLRDCETFMALDRRLPGILSGEDRPADSAEMLQFAELCHWKRRFATAVRFYQNAFEVSPMIESDPRRPIRYNAACAAALAGTGAAVEPEDIVESERKHYRDAALGWLQSELAMIEQGLADGTAQERAARGQRLASWRRDPDLAAVREQVGLEQMPPDERQAWSMFWADVEKLAQPVPPAR